MFWDILSVFWDIPSLCFVASLLCFGTCFLCCETCLLCFWAFLSCLGIYHVCVLGWLLRPSDAKKDTEKETSVEVVAEAPSIVIRRRSGDVTTPSHALPETPSPTLLRTLFSIQRPYPNTMVFEVGGMDLSDFWCCCGLLGLIVTFFS